MTLSTRLRAEAAFVESILDDQIICPRCQATIYTFGEKCTAELSDMCPGFEAIENAKQEFRSTERSS